MKQIPSFLWENLVFSPENVYKEKEKMSEDEIIVKHKKSVKMMLEGMK